MGKQSSNRYDAIVVGAGFAGLYMTHKFKKQGLTVKTFEAGADVGGTWYWNRYLEQDATLKAGNILSDFQANSNRNGHGQSGTHHNLKY